MDKTFETFLAESSLSRVFKHYKEHDSGTISAFRSAEDCGEGNKISLSENKNRNALLKAKLLRLGYGVTPIKGVYIENYGSDSATDVYEESFVVIDIQDKGDLKKNLKRLGEEFEQDSITFSKKSGEYYIIGTSPDCKNAYPPYKEEVRLGAPLFGEGGEFHSKVNGRPFVFNQALKDDLEVLGDHTPTEIRSIKNLSEKNISEITFQEFLEDTTTADVAIVPSKLGSVEKRKFPNEGIEDALAEPEKIIKKRKQRHHHAHW